MSEPIFQPFHVDAIAEAVKHLDRALDGYLLIALVSDPEQKKEATREHWKGGAIQAIGLATEFAHTQSLRGLITNLKERGDE